MAALKLAPKFVYLSPDIIQSRGFLAGQVG